MKKNTPGHLGPVNPGHSGPVNPDRPGLVNPGRPGGGLSNPAEAGSGRLHASGRLRLLVVCVFLMSLSSVLAGCPPPPHRATPPAPPKPPGVYVSPINKIGNLGV